MRKVLMVGLLALSGVALAEESGAFVGLDVGFAKGEVKASGTDLGGLSWDGTKATNDANYVGIKVGYNYFFAPSVGVRVYGSASSSQADFSFKHSLTGDVNTKLSYTTFAANVDLLANFYTDSATDFGAFVGVGAGVLNGKFEDKIITGVAAEATGAEYPPLNESLNGTYFDAKVGLRLMAAQHHGMDLTIKIPFSQGKVSKDGVELKTKQKYILTLGYSYHF